MFEKFTDRARRVIVLSQEEARVLGHHHIGTEHLLLALIHEGEGVGAAVLGSLGISLEVTRVEVERVIGRGGVPPQGHIPFTFGAKMVLELSLREALQLDHYYIGTEHLLLGLVREGSGVGAQILLNQGADLSRVRQQVLQLLAGYSGSPGYEVAEEVASDAAEVDLVARIGVDGVELIVVDGSGTEQVVGPDDSLYSLLYHHFASSASLKAGLAQLESLISSPGIREQELQDLLEAYPELLHGFDYSEAVPHVVLESERGNLIPDFVLRGVGHRPLCDLVELKLPDVPLITTAGGRPQFTRKVASAVSQLNDYAEALEDPRVRNRVAERYQLEIFRPRLHLIIGRSSGLDRTSVVRACGRDAGGRLHITTWDDVVARGRLRFG